MRLGIFGAGKLSSVLARLALSAGHQVDIAGSSDLKKAGDAKASARSQWAYEVASADIVILAIPITAVQALPADLLAGRTVIDATNYWWESDGHRPELADPTTSTSETVATWLPGATVVKALNHASVWELENLGRPKGHKERRGIAIAGDSPAAVSAVSDLVDSLGFEPVVAGVLAEGVRFEPGTDIFGADATAAELAGLLERFWTSQRGLVVARARAAHADAARADAAPTQAAS